MGNNLHLFFVKDKQRNSPVTNFLEDRYDFFPDNKLSSPTRQFVVGIFISTNSKNDEFYKQNKDINATRRCLGLFRLV